MKAIKRLALSTLLVVAMLAVVVAMGMLAAGQEMAAQADGPDQYQYQCDVYIEQGCSKLVIASGGELEVQSGGALDVDGNVSSSTGAFTITDDIMVTGNSTLGDAAGDTVTINGDAAVNGYRDGSSGYDYFFSISGDITGTTSGAKTYGAYINMSRPVGSDAVADIDDAGLKIRVDNDATANYYGYVLRGLDVNAKNDDGASHPAVTTLSGASISAQTDHTAGESYTADAYGLQVGVTVNARVTNTLVTGDFRHFRQAATEPTTENIVQIRQANTSGTGVDAGLYFKSDSSGETDDFDYVIDMSAADVDDADIRLSNGETIKNTTDTAVQISGFLALEEGAAIDLGAGFTITPTASYQPVTNSTGGSITSDATTAIADGPVAGSLLVICNEDAQDVVLKDAANTQLGGDITLTGGADDCITLLWDGNDWTALSVHDN